MIDIKYKNIILLLSIISSFIFGIIITFNFQSNCYFLVLLPFVFSLFTLFYFVINKKKPLFVGSFIIIISYYIRMSITPLFMSLGNYFSFKPPNLNYDLAVLFMIYEYFIVSIMMVLLTCKKQPEDCFYEKKFSFVYSKSLKRILIILICICIFFCIMYPQILNAFKVGIISNAELIQWKIRYNNALNSTPKLIFYLISWIMKIIKEVLVFSVLLMIKNKKSDRHKVFLSLLVIICASAISDDTLAQNIYFALIYFLILGEFYKKEKSKIYGSLFITIGFIFIYGLLGERFSAESLEKIFFNIANTFQVYFTGVYNVAVSINLDVTNPIKIIEGDFLRSIPLLKTFFVDYATSTTVFSDYINDPYGSQIIPSIGQSMFMFGKVLSPLIAAFFTFLTLKYESRILKLDSYFERFIYYIIIVKLACVPVIYNGQIFMQGLFGTIVPLLLILMFDKRRKLND